MKVSKLLQENHEKYHIFFNSSGFHNHIVHHLLTIWAIKASPADLQRNYDVNMSYQRPATKSDSQVLKNLYDPEKFGGYLGIGRHYNDFLEFYRAEMDEKGWPAVVNEQIFAKDTMLLRLFAGIVHPLIHLGFGVEFHQPAIVAEALAQTACHRVEGMDSILLAPEQAVKADKGDKSIVELLDELQESKTQKTDILSQVHVQPSQLEEKTAEMINAVTYFTGGCRRHNRFDFYAIHNVNASIFFPVFLKQDWLSNANKVRLLEWKIRFDLHAYSRLSSKIDIQGIREYKPKKPSGWDGVLDRACGLSEDGHAAKFIRALAHGEQACRPYEDREDFRLKHGDWLQLAHMAIDSVETNGDSWSRL